MTIQFGHTCALRYGMLICTHMRVSTVWLHMCDHTVWSHMRANTVWSHMRTMLWYAHMYTYACEQSLVKYV